MSYARPLFSVMALASLTLTACSAPGEVDEAIATAQEASLTSNSLTSNSLTSNSLTSNSLTSNSLTSNSLTSNSLTSNSLTSNALTDPSARDLLKYVVSCALPAGAHVNVTVQGVTYTYDGQLGLAPEWGQAGGSCDHDCQGWVSACLLARIDYLGQSKQISVRGDDPALNTTQSERSAYNKREATYYGNVFASPQQRYACLSPGKTQIPRVCGPSIQGCVVDVVGSCDDVCGHARSDGSFPDCWNQAGDDDDQHDHSCGDHDKSPHGASEYHGSITVFLKP